jgi:metal-responsive CopG/Arc/MetJ family transcriptional regulator
MAVKISISISQEILDQLDRAAKEAKTSRSAMLSKALLNYLEEKRKEEQYIHRKKASDSIDRIRKIIGPWDGTAEVLKWRDLH